ncbi:hypothetical protein H257_13294 [Aphanomyces astaci]|uniref:Uncharacterized protein n=1 Tax=Aphanomyces astaci TaxID=112090 RepID=W4FXK9_APHAT|nr:hypothetical protein H257_13294 [Aphanomyces astaci]ETV71408.1 hypothetical protein H257_13294 [Aphanomyces astaci]|eukprot:XP_009839073.1 hypothetical protein H257_13294 [Aphanomyces astaci]
MSPRQRPGETNKVSVEGQTAWSVYFIDALRAPSCEWNDRYGTVHKIKTEFNIPSGSRDSVLKVLQESKTVATTALSTTALVLIMVD